MRLMASRTVTAKRGDLVSIRCRLRPGMDMDRLYVWSCTPGSEMFVPHIQHTDARTDILIGGKPVMTTPMSTTLRDPVKREHTIEFYADEKLRICVRQEADKADEPVAKVKIHSYGPWALKLRSFWRRLTSKDSRNGAETLPQG